LLIFGHKGLPFFTVFRSIFCLEKAPNQMTRGIYKIPEGGIRQVVGRNVKAAREYSGLSQRELCEKANIGQAYLSQCESGKWNIGVDNIYRIAVVTGFAAHDLLDPQFEPASIGRSKSRG
jgi:ribosome-binding protein aMBF1 (putative translation factor)